MEHLSSQDLMAICDGYWEALSIQSPLTPAYNRYVQALNELAKRGSEIRDWCRRLVAHPDYDARECGAFLLGELGKRGELGDAEKDIIAELTALTQRPVESDAKELQAVDAAFEALAEIGKAKPRQRRSSKKKSLINESTLSLSLLDGRYAPITNAIGFLEADFARVVEADQRWREQIVKTLRDNLATPSNPRPTVLGYSGQRVSGPLPALLDSLLPLTGPCLREIWIRTTGSWTAYFDNFVNGSDPFPSIS